MKHNPWSYEEEKYLRENYPEGSTQEIALYLGRTEKAVRSRAKILRLLKAGDQARRPWTPQEDQYLIDHYPDEDTRQIMKAIIRTKSSVFGRAAKLGLEKTPEAKSRLQKPP